MTYPAFVVTEDIVLADAQNGDAYETSVFSETVVDDGIITALVQTNNHIGDLLHIEAHAGGLSLLEISEVNTIETPGTGLTLVNYNRVSSKTSVATVTRANSFSDATAIFDELIGQTGQGNRAFGGASGVNFILAGNSSYAITVQNLSGGVTNIYLGIELIDRAD
jgi:hypothetical protein